MNVSSVSTLSLDGLAQLYEHRFLFLVLFLLLYVFVLLSDGLVVYVICSQRSLHRPMYVFVVAVLVNSVVGSSTIYPKLLWDLLQGRRVVLLSCSDCLGQTFVLSSLGGSSFLLLSTMAFDRYLSICYPLRYATLMSPTTVTALLLLCWLVPAFLAAGAVAIASQLQLCIYKVTRLYCAPHTVISMSCESGKAIMSEVYGLLTSAVVMFFPIAFVLFSYGRILVLCLQHSHSFASKALNTCLPHVIVFLNYSVCSAFELMHRRVPNNGQTQGTITTSVLTLIVPTVFNPIVYGLKVREIYGQLKKLLHCHRSL